MSTEPQYPIGYQREDWPELWGWGEVHVAAGRSDQSMRDLIAEFADQWPGPVAVLKSTPVFSAEEVREFLRLHPRQVPPPLTPMERQRVYVMKDAGVSVEDIAMLLERSKPTIYRYLDARRSRPVSKGRAKE